MSQENVETVRALLTAYGGQDMVAFVRDTDPAQMHALIEAGYDPEVEVVWVDTSPDSRPYHGHEGALQATLDWLEAFEEFHFEPTEFIDAGDSVIVSMHQWGRGKESGAEVEMTTAWVCAVKGGRLARVREYSSKAKALETAGLSE